MGNTTSFALRRACFVSSCVFNKKRNHLTVKVVKRDGQVMSFTSPVFVIDVLVRLSKEGVCEFGIGLSKESNSENLPLEYELEIGKVYHVTSSVKRVKIVVTKRQLKKLLDKQISAEEVLLGLQKKKLRLPRTVTTKSRLESIPEEIE